MRIFYGLVLFGLGIAGAGSVMNTSGHFLRGLASGVVLALGALLIASEYERS